MNLESVLIEFSEVVNNIYGLYLDSTQGFLCIKKQIEDTQSKFIQSGFTQKNLDDTPVTYQVGKTSNEFNYKLHECSQNEFKIRNSRGGKNWIELGNLCVVQLYQYWEDHYRKKIRSCLKLTELKSDIFGDLRYLRNSIIHNNSIAVKEISKCKIIKLYMPNEKIRIDEFYMERIIALVKKEINALGKSPYKLEIN